MTIAQLVYASASSTASRLDIESLLKAARSNNKRLHLTGYLCFRDGRFLQVLEGTPAAVSDMYTCIANDRRHSNLMLLGYERILKRRFSGWAMGYVADSAASQRVLFDYSGRNEFEPSEMDHQSAIEFLREIAEIAAHRTPAQGGLTPTASAATPAALHRLVGRGSFAPTLW